MTNRQTQNEMLAIAHKLADAAAQKTLFYFRSADLQAENKQAQGFDPVTRADQEAETAMRRILEKTRPNDAILGEEESAKSGTSGLSWVLDPIDGTRGFLCGTPNWGTLIAVCGQDGPFIGIIDQPYIKERFIGTPRGAFLQRGTQQTRLTAGRHKTLKEALLFTTFPEIGTQKERDAFQNLSKQCRLTRYGMDCYAYALLAMGQIDLVVEAGLQPYDVQAPIALVQAAGGIATNWRGGAAHQGGQIICAGSPAIHEAALTYLRPFASG